MRTWDITKAKFYSELMNWMTGFLGLNADEATEAEVHSAATAITGTIETMKTAAVEEAKEAVKTEMATVTASIQTLTDQVTALQTKADDAATKVTELTGQIETLQNDLKSKDAELATKEGAHAKRVAELSGEIAKLKTGAVAELEVKTETIPGGEAGDKGARRGNVVVVKNEALDNFFGRKSAPAN